MRALRGEQFADYEVLRVRPNGERRRVVSTGTCVRDANGRVELAIVMLRDVTELRRLEQQREEYLALVSHDVRNPLSTISMAISTVKMSTAKRQTTDQDVTFLERAERNVRRMTAMLDELTDATSLESGRGEVERVGCDLREIVASAVDSMDDQRRARLTLEIEDASPFAVLGDAPRLERVVANLLTNALKYSPDQAPVQVRLGRAGRFLELDVRDRGIGIAPESVRQLFQRYYRTSAGKARASGLGLGLYIARLIVEAHGGQIEVSSEVGKGSTFKVLLPASPATAG